MVQSIEQRDVFGKIGEGLGRGFSDQLPKEMDRYRLSQGLANIVPSSDPMKLYGQVAGIPGMTPEMMSAVIPMLMSKAQFAAMEQSSPQGQAQPQGALALSSGAVPRGAAMPAPGAQQPTAKSNDYVTEADMAAANAPIYVPNQNEINAEALRLHTENPARYPNAQVAEQAAINILNQKAQKIESERALASGKIQRETDALNSFNDRLTKRLQAESIEGTWKDLPDAQQQYFRNLVKQGLLSNQPIDKLVNEVAGKALEFVKSRNVVRTAGTTDLFTRGKYKSKINSAKKAYQDSGQQELLQDDLIAYQGVSPEQAAYEAYGVSKEIDSLISKTPKQKLIEKQSINGQQIPAQVLNKIISSLGPNDNIPAIQWALKNAGFDDRSFIQATQSSDKNWSEAQQNQINRLSPADVGLNDMWYKFLVK